MNDTTETTIEIVEAPTDSRLPLPAEMPERWIVQAWHWHADAYGGPRWIFVCLDCHDRKTADECAQRRIDEGNKVARIVRIPGGAA